MSASPPGHPIPGREQEILARHAGRWRIKSRFFMGGAGAPAFEMEAEEVVEMIGPWWTVSRYRASMMGMPFEGVATLGYDTVKKKWVGSWMDSFGPFSFMFEGDLDASGKVITMHCIAANPQTQQLARYRTTATEIDANHSRFEMVRMPLEGGPEILMFINEYTRA